MRENWCDECLDKQAKVDTRVGMLIAPVGWCAPSETLYGFVEDQGCYVVEAHTLGYYVDMCGDRKPKKAIRAWKRNRKEAGTMIHAFMEVPGFPQVSAVRGGISYGTPQ